MSTQTAVIFDTFVRYISEYISKNYLCKKICFYPVWWNIWEVQSQDNIYTKIKSVFKSLITWLNWLVQLIEKLYVLVKIIDCHQSPKVKLYLQINCKNVNKTMFLFLDPSYTMIAALPNKKFLNYLIYSFIFQTGLMIYGRPEFYFLLAPSVYTVMPWTIIIINNYCA